WVATTAAALRATLAWAERLEALGRFGEAERLVVGIGFSEYLGQLVGGVPMSQNEYARPHAFGLSAAGAALAAAAAYFFEEWNGVEAREALVRHVGAGGAVDEMLDDEL